jgi:hypothetical protein
MITDVALTKQNYYLKSDVTVSGKLETGHFHDDRQLGKKNYSNHTLHFTARRIFNP